MPTDLLKTVEVWKEEMWKNYPEIVSRMKTDRVDADLMFNANNEAVVLSAMSGGGKSSLAYALSKVSTGLMKLGGSDQVLVIRIPGYLYAGSAFVDTLVRARAYGEHLPVDQTFQMGPVKTVIEMFGEKEFRAKGLFFRYVQLFSPDFPPEQLTDPIDVIGQAHQWVCTNDPDGFQPAIIQRFKHFCSGVPRRCRKFWSSSFVAASTLA